MALPNTFANETSPDMIELDENFAAVGALTPIPGTISGTNSITHTPLNDTPTVSAYANYMQFTGIASATNTGAVTFQVAALAALAVYKDTIVGPVALTGGEIVQNTKLILMYDSTLNGGAGGFHLVSPASQVVREKTTLITIAMGAIPPNGASTATITLGGCSVADIVGIGFPGFPSVGLVWTGSVPNAGTVCVNAFNAFWTAATITPNAGSYRISTRGYSA